MPDARALRIGTIDLSNEAPLVVIAGPCAIESRAHAFDMARAIDALMRELGCPFIFKSSFDKANRSRGDSARGVGMEEGLAILAAIRSEIGCPVMTDVHEPQQCATVAQGVDVLQIPAFLCRQTDLLVAAGQTRRVVNVKKGQFMAPWDMMHVIETIAATGNTHIMVTERGTSFGYHRLVNDMRALPIMRQWGYPVVFDATHSVQQPGGGVSGGEREFILPLARAACAVGCAALFVEVHDNPEQAISDARSMLPLAQLKDVVRQVRAIDALIKTGTVE